MLTRSESSTPNPTVEQILAAGKNIIAFAEDAYFQTLSKSYWPKKHLHSNWQGKSNPEELFKHRSEVLKEYKEIYPSRITDISGAITLDTDSISIGFDETRSFEGAFHDLISLSRYGANTHGMKIRNERLYSSGNSVHYQGVNSMYRHWLTRPDMFKPNIIYVDDAVKSSTIVSTAIEANMKLLKREVTIAFQGSPRSGFYHWFEGEISGAYAATLCEEVLARCIVRSDDYNITEYHTFEARGEVHFQEGYYPPNTTVTVQVAHTNSNNWYDLYANTIQYMIDHNLDLYVRGGVAEGTAKSNEYFAYISKKYNLFGDSCGIAPESGYENLVTW